jgi:serine/threonine-protein kinase
VTYSSVFYRVRGKVGYMSPEMARNQPIDARSDLFSLGVSMYETLIGERIYTGDLNTPPDKIYAQVVPPLASKCPGLPPGLQEVLNKALAIDRDARFPDAESFAHALRQVAITYHLLYSAPEFAAELREIMGSDPEHWLSDKRDPLHARPSRAGQAPGTATDDSANALVEPGASINAGEDSDLENVATPPARASSSMPGVDSRSSAKLPVVTSRPSGQMPAVTSRSSGQMPIVTSQSSGQMPAAPGNVVEAMAPTPPPPAAPPVAAPPVVAPPAAAPPIAAPPQRAPFAFPGTPLSGRSGGVAAFKRSRRGLWIAVLLVLAILLGFGFVRFFLRPESQGRSLRAPMPAHQAVCVFRSPQAALLARFGARAFAGDA